jgi:pilus assembly protein Flp/PilA
MVDVDSKERGQAVHCSQIQELSLLDLASSPTKGTEMLSRLVKFQAKAAALRDDRGATAVEYGLMVALIAIVIIVAVTLLGHNLSILFNNVATTV